MEKKNMPYVYSLPTSPSFKGKGLLGYTFGPLNQDLDFYYIQVEKGHDTFMISKKITRTYYVLSGTGYFTIDNDKYDVGAGVVVEVPSGVEYCYSGKMTMIAFGKPRWFGGNETHTKWNPDVVGEDCACVIDRPSWLTRLARRRLLGKSPVGAYLRLNQRLWNALPTSFTALASMHLYGSFLHRLARIEGVRGQAFSTFFLRNPAELELVRRLLEGKRNGAKLRVAVLGCSTGPEAYSVAWRIRSARPDLTLLLHAMDISQEAVEVAKRGAYSLAAPQLTATNVFERMTTAEMKELFDQDGDVLTVKSWIKQGIHWQVGDVRERELLDALGPQDMVVANNFLCHMYPSEAERCLRNIARLVSPYGHLFVSGIDIDVRTKVACDLRWKPLQELLEEIHEGGVGLRSHWPFQYGGLEPMNRRRRDWRIRYASVFQIVPRGGAPSMRLKNEPDEPKQGVRMGPHMAEEFI
jgi:SAM-dependent methyltransferase